MKRNWTRQYLRCFFTAPPSIKLNSLSSAHPTSYISQVLPQDVYLRYCHEFSTNPHKKVPIFISADILIHFDPFSSTRWHHLHLCLSWSDLVYLCLSWSVSYHHRVALNAHQVLKVRWIGLDGPMNASLLITVTGFQSSQVPLSISQKAKLEQLV